MTLHAWRLPPGLDPLLAGAKRRATRRRVLVVAALLVLGGGAATVSLHPAGLLRTGAPRVEAYEPGGMFTGTGGPAPDVDTRTAGVSTISVAAGGDAWALGSVAWRWDGRTWQRVPLPRVGNAELWAVAARTPDEAWAVGARGPGYLAASHALIERWDGSRWSVVQLPRLPTSFLFGVSAAGAHNAWAVGGTFGANHAGRFVSSKTRPLLLRWDGRAWRRQSVPWARRGVVLDKVVSTGPSDVWVISSGQQDSSPSGPVVVEHWNGSRWQAVPAPFGQSDPFAGFTATAWNDAWAVGSYGQGGNRVAKFSHSLAAHWNGRSWRLTHVPMPAGGSNSAALVDVAAARPDDVWALGQSQRLELQGNNGLSGTGPATFFLHWSGQRWQIAPGATPPIYDGRPAIVAARDGSAWTVGYCRTDDYVARWDGRAWVTTPHPADVHWRAGPPARLRHGPPPTCSVQH